MKTDNEIEELCKKLKPVIGDDADKLWYMYLAEDNNGRKKLSFKKSLGRRSVCKGLCNSW